MTCPVVRVTKVGEEEEAVRELPGEVELDTLMAMEADKVGGLTSLPEVNVEPEEVLPTQED